MTERPSLAFPAKAGIHSSEGRTVEPWVPASPYRQMRRAGLTNLVCFPFVVTFDRPGGPIWRYREDHVLSLLTEEELGVWHEARAKAAQEGLLMMVHPLHCAVGTKP